MQTGSFYNHLMSRSTLGQPTPEIGMGATILCWTDRHAATITDVWKHRGKLAVTVQEDRATRTDKFGMSETQTYVYERNPAASPQHFAFDGKTWRELIDGRMTRGHGLQLGVRREYHDFSF